MNPLARLDQRYVWHPFTQMKAWAEQEPIVIVRGQGSYLEDAQGTRYLDGNSSIWTNLHGHNHPKINRALRKQLTKIAHSSALGLANEPAALLGERLVAMANPAESADARTGARLEKVFYSDDGSTALEVSLKLAYQFTSRTRPDVTPRFLALEGAYHGDTIGAVSLGHIDLFHHAYERLLFSSDAVMAPYCYRCPYNRAVPERADARDYRKCQWECVGAVEEKFATQKKCGQPYTAMVIEPLLQGAAGMIPQPAGWVRRVTEIVRHHGALLIADEVMTAFGRTTGADSTATFFASHQEGVQPDLLAVAKGLTGGYLPMAATLTSQSIFDAFLGEYSEFKTFFHGHSYTGNQLGAAAALASLDLLQASASTRARRKIAGALTRALARLWDLPAVGDIRQVGLVAGVELVKDWTTRQPFALSERVGGKVCEAMARRGVLTRPIGNVIVLMPPYSTSAPEVETMVHVLADSIGEVLGRQSKIGN